MNIGAMMEFRLSGDCRKGLGEKYIPNGASFSYFRNDIFHYCILKAFI